MSRQYWRVELPTACFALESEWLTVVAVAPYGRKSVTECGRSLPVVLGYWRQRGARVCCLEVGGEKG